MNIEERGKEENNTKWFTPKSSKATKNKKELIKRKVISPTEPTEEEENTDNIKEKEIEVFAKSAKTERSPISKEGKNER